MSGIRHKQKEKERKLKARARWLRKRKGRATVRNCDVHAPGSHYEFLPWS